MTMNDLLNAERAVNAELRARIAKLELMVIGRPEFDLSTVHGREQAVCKRLELMGLKDDKINRGCDLSAGVVDIHYRGG